MLEWHKTEFAEYELERLDVCDVCGSPSHTSQLLFNKLGLSVVKCLQCGITYVNPRLRRDILWQRYSQDFFQNEYLPQHGDYDEQANYNIHFPYLRQLGQIAPARGRLFDVGCAIGLFLAAARLDGWEVMGNELSRFAADYALKRFNIPVIAGNFETVDLSPGSFDAITMWETIEHVQSPRTALRKAAALLRPGGVLALSTPNVAGLTFWSLRDRWWVVAPKEHIFYFTPKTITQLLDRTGFEVVKMWTAGLDYHYLRNMWMGRTVMPWHIHATQMRAQTSASSDRAAPERQAMLAWPSLKRRAINLIARIVRRTTLGDSMVVYAVRKGRPEPE